MPNKGGDTQKTCRAIDRVFFTGKSLHQFREGYEAMEDEIKFLLTHVSFEPNSNTNREHIMDRIPTMMKLMGWMK